MCPNEMSTSYVLKRHQIGHEGTIQSTYPPNKWTNVASENFPPNLATTTIIVYELKLHSTFMIKFQNRWKFLLFTLLSHLDHAFLIDLAFILPWRSRACTTPSHTQISISICVCMNVKILKEHTFFLKIWTLPNQYLHTALDKVLHALVIY